MMNRPNTSLGSPASATGIRSGRNAIVYNTGFAASGRPVNPDLLSVIRLIRQRHESVLQATRSPSNGESLARSLVSLRLAESALQKSELLARHPEHPIQIAVIGPTQVGKSSVTNLLLGTDLARVSPLAGFTVHPQGFSLGTEGIAWAAAYFGQSPTPLDRLSAERYDAYALTDAGGAGHTLAPAVVWDTPDFDSVDADDYRAGVLRTVALADVVLLVVSKDKYADQTVWDTMRLLEPLGQPTAICLNKVPDESAAALSRSLEEKWRSVREDAPAPVVVLPYLEKGPGALTAARNALDGVLRHCIARVHREAQEAHCRELLRRHWSAWTAPARIEHAALAEWRRHVEEATAAGLAVYQRDFLDHPQHYETFQRALAELLTLLEIPGVARALMTARSIVTWPVRQLSRLGRSLSGYKGEAGQEIAVLRQAVDHLLLQLGEIALERAEEAGAMRDWWQEVAQLLRREQRLQADRSYAAITAYHRAFQPEIEHTARQLYDRLREHPAILNSLRATRLTTDAAALAMALHTGGIGVQDFVLAPAILSLTSLLAESALGHYLSRAEAELKQRQRQLVAELLNREPGVALARLPERLRSEGRFQLPEAALQSVESEIFSHA
jgi:GTPase SAR1 family protein